MEAVLNNIENHLVKKKKISFIHFPNFCSVKEKTSDPKPSSISFPS